MDSNKSSATRAALQPQRRPGRQRVAALLKAGAAVIAEKGYEGATMAEIAERAGSPIGSMYRFFPGKEALADALIGRYAGLVAEAFEKINSSADPARTDKTADALLNLFFDLRRETNAMVALLEGRSEGSELRMAFRKNNMRHIADTLKTLAPKLPRKMAADMAVVVLHNMKTMSAFSREDAGPGAMEELRRMNRLYIAARLASFLPAK